MSLGQLGHIMTNVADTLMLGNYDPDHLSAAAFAFGVQIFPLILCLGLSMGITPIVANAVGENDEQKISSVLANSLALFLPLGILIAYGSYLCSPFLFYMGQEPIITQLGQGYFEVVCLSLMPLMFFQPFKQFAEGMADTRTAMVISLVGNVVNIMLNYTFIYGKFGMPAMGLLGAAYATFFARVLMALAMAFYVLRSSKFRSYVSSLSIRLINKMQITRILKMSIPIAIQFTLEGGAFSIAVIMTGWLGRQYTAAHNIALQMATISFILMSGIAQATTVKVGNFMGSRNFVELKKVMNNAMLMSTVFMGCCGLVFYFGRGFWPTLFVENNEIVGIASNLLIIAALFQLIDAVQHIAVAALRGMNDVRVPTLVSTISYWIICIPMSYIMAFHMDLGIYGIWYGIVFGLLCSAILQLCRFYYLYKRTTLRVEQKV